jgi:hypothetical protein
MAIIGIHSLKLELVDSEPSDDDFDAVEETPEEQDIMITSTLNCSCKPFY